MILESVEQPEGDGARVRRSIGRPEIRNFDPFLLLDEMNTRKAGFPVCENSVCFLDQANKCFVLVKYSLIHIEDLKL